MRKGEQTRQEIIREAAPIFNQRGYEGAALSDLMKATGLEKGGIYRHFEGKQQLAAEAFDYAWNLAIDTRFEGTLGISNSISKQVFVRRSSKGGRKSHEQAEHTGRIGFQNKGEDKRCAGCTSHRI